MNIDEIRELILLLDQTGISDLELQKDDFRLVLRKMKNAEKIPAAAPTADIVAGGPQSVEEPQYEDVIEVLAPMVGTFYAAPSPDSDPYVKVGDRVDTGQTLCILEAMKLMNEIKSDFAGTVVAVMVENAEAVEYGQVLFMIKKD